MSERTFFENSLARIESKRCKKCDGSGRVVDIRDKHLHHTSSTVECSECMGTGFGEVLPVEHADKALKKMIKICTPEFFNDIPFTAVKHAFMVNPTAETIYENEGEDILIIKLFEDVVICFKDKRVAWIEF